MFKGGKMGALSVGAAASRFHSPSGCMQWDSKYETMVPAVLNLYVGCRNVQLITHWQPNK